MTKGFIMERRVKFFKKYIDSIMSHSYIIVGIIVFSLLYSQKAYLLSVTVKLLGDIVAYNNDLITDLTSVFIAAMVSIIFSKIKYIRSLIPYVKSSIYIALMNQYEKKGVGFWHWIVPIFIKLFYSYKRITLPQQQKITDQILDILSRESNSNKKNIFWIIGDAYSGKTSAVLNLFTDLITKSRYHSLFIEVDGHIEYFDFGRDDCNIKTFCKNYSNGKYKNSILIIDNIHKITQDSGLRSINNIIRNFNAFAVIVLMRPPEDFIMQKEIVEAFEATIREEGHSFHLSKIHCNDYNKDNDFRVFVEEYGLNIFTPKGTILFHFVKIFLKGEYKKKLIKDIVSFLSRNEDTDLSLLLMYIVSSSIFTGSFNVKFIIKEIQKENPHYNVRKYLRELYDIGFLNSYPNESSAYFFFHEDLAKFYFSKTYLGRENIYNRIFEKLYFHYQGRGKKYFAYLYSFIIQAQGNNEKLFEEVVINVNYQTILKELEYLLSTSPTLEESYHKELGILYDRNGELLKAQKEYIAYYEECSATQKAAAFFEIIQADHPYFVAHKDEAYSYLASTDLYSRLLAEYWIIHMNMHYGKFDFDRMEGLLSQIESSVKELIGTHPYDSLHLIRRSFFDFFRLYYISGVCDYKRLSALKCVNIRTELNRYLEEYQAYYNKFVYGHYLLYEALFRKGILGKNIEKEEYQAIFSEAPGIKYENVTSKEGIIKFALEFYKMAYDFMYKMGDKTYYFVNCRYMEAMAADGHYKEPYEFYSNFKDYANQQQIVYYQACAEIYLFKLEFIHLFSEESLTIQNNSYYKGKVEESEAHLLKAKCYYKKADTYPENDYAKAMVELYEILFYSYIGKKSKEYVKKRIQRLEKVCHVNHYLRELHIIELISQNDYTLAPYMVKDIVSYYPIVAQ